MWTCDLFLAGSAYSLVRVGSGSSEGGACPVGGDRRDGITFGVLVGRSVLCCLSGCFMTETILTKTIFVLVEVLFSAPSLIACVVLCTFAPSSFERERTLLEISSKCFLTVTSLAS